MVKKKKVVKKIIKKTEAIDWKFIVLLVAIFLVGLSVLVLVNNF